MKRALGKRVYGKSLLLLGIGLLFMGSICSHLPLTFEDRDNGDFLLSSPKLGGWLIPAPPINISGDSEWANCPWVNGSGTIEDPYLLRNLTINTGGTGSCISISNTSKYFEIINCTTSTAETESNNAGIYLNCTGNGTIFNNTCYNSGFGIYLANATNNTLSSNTCYQSRCGIILDSSNNNTLFGNIIRKNTLYGLVIDYNSDNNSILQNNCTENDWYGIFLWHGSDNNSVAFNNCTRNLHDGISLSSVSNNSVVGNTCSENSQYGLSFYSARGCNISSNYCTTNPFRVDNSKYTNLSGNVLVNCSIMLTGDMYNLYPIFIEPDNTVNGLPVRTFWSQTGITIPEDTGQALLINCNYSIIENYRNPGIVLSLLRSSNIVIRNNTCTGGSFGLFMFMSNNNTLVNNNCTGNSRDGIYVFDYCRNTTVTGNNCTANARNGIFLDFGCSNSTLANNKCTGNAGDGIYLAGCSIDLLINNNCTSNAGAGIHLYMSSQINISLNFCTENKGFGIHLDYGDNCLISENTCSNNTQDGIYIFRQSTNNILDNNYCIMNSGRGIKLFSDADNNILVNNNCTENSMDGIYLSMYSNYNTLTANNCWKNKQCGICLYIICNNNTLIENNCWDNQQCGIYLYFASGNSTLTSNNCTGNLYGIYLYLCDNSSISSSNCTKNVENGIILDFSNSTFIAGNTCDKNDIGIGLSGTCYFNEVCQNWIKKNAVSQLICDNPTNYIHDNTFINYSLASFTVNVSSLIAGQWVNFTDTSTSGGLPEEYQWNFGDLLGNETTPDVIRKYATEGTWTATLTLKDSEGDVSVAQQMIYVEQDYQPIATITPAPITIPLGTIAELHATITGNSPANYIWDFGDESAFVNGTSVTHLYSAPGTYTVTLNVTDADGDFATTTTQVTVTNTNPWINHLSPISFIKGTSGNQIIWQVLDPNVINPTYTVTRDGLTIASNPWTPNSSIIVDLDSLDVGTYSFTLSIDDGYGGVTVESVTVTVESVTETVTAPGWGVEETIITIIVSCVGIVGVILIQKLRTRSKSRN